MSEWIPPDVEMGEYVHFWHRGKQHKQEPTLCLVTKAYGNGSIAGVILDPKSPPRSMVDVCYHDSDPLKEKHLRIAEDDARAGTWTHRPEREFQRALLELAQSLGKWDALCRIIAREMAAIEREKTAKKPAKVVEKPDDN